MLCRLSYGTVLLPSEGRCPPSLPARGHMVAFAHSTLLPIPAPQYKSGCIALLMEDLQNLETLAGI